MSLPIEDIAIRIFIALIVGTLIGVERTIMHKPAGMRTHALVCITSTMLTITSAYGFENFVSANKDPARLLANIITGIGFLAGGVIYTVHKQEDKTIKGLTTAAGIWAVAGLGIPIGLGHQWLVLITFIAMKFSLYFEKILDKIFIKKALKNKNARNKNLKDVKEE